MAGRALVPKVAPAPEPYHTEPFPTLEQRIRARAHLIYLERAGQAGSALDDWLQAEAEIESEEI